MRAKLREKYPLLFLVVVSVWWAFYYQSESALNELGSANFEWLYLIDGLIVLPVICYLTIKDKKAALVKAVTYALIVVLVGSYIIPEENKFIWKYLESLRYAALGAIVVLEVLALSSVYISIRNSLVSKQEPDLAISDPIEKTLGKGIVASILSFETRMWSYALFANRIDPKLFSGKEHFSYHQKDGAKSNSLGFILLFLFEMPIMHLILHFAWSPLAASIISLITLYGLVFFIAEYRALSIRPISIDAESLYLRYGIFNPQIIPLKLIESVEPNNIFIRRNSSLKRYNLSGDPNVVITLKKPIGKIGKIYIGLDNPVQFINSVNSKNH